jgi:hypothetical protein
LAQIEAVDACRRLLAQQVSSGCAIASRLCNEQRSVERAQRKCTFSRTLPIIKTRSNSLPANNAWLTDFGARLSCARLAGNQNG